MVATTDTIAADASVLYALCSVHVSGSFQDDVELRRYRPDGSLDAKLGSVPVKPNTGGRAHRLALSPAHVYFLHRIGDSQRDLLRLAK